MAGGSNTGHSPAFWRMRRIAAYGKLTCKNYADRLYWQNQSVLNGVPLQPIMPATYDNFEFSYSHRFKSESKRRSLPFYRRGYDVPALVANPRTDANGNLLLNPDGTVIFGPTTATTLGVDRTTDVELFITKEAAFGFSGQLSGTYINETSNVILGERSLLPVDYRAVARTRQRIPRRLPLAAPNYSRVAIQDEEWLAY